MTERREAAVWRTVDYLSIGPSSLAWEDGVLTVEIRERGAPLPRPVVGRVRLSPRIANGEVFLLDRGGRHGWQPIAPSARVEVAFEQPRGDWQGEGYCDSNFGSVPLEADFRRWDWSRSANSGEPLILYDLERRDGSREALALRFDAAGVERLHPPPRRPLPRTRIWRVARHTLADEERPRLRQTLEDTPFYARSLVSAPVAGTERLWLHESLDLDRFRRGWVKLLLPFRMPRAFL